MTTETIFTQAIESSLSYPNGRVTTSYAGYTNRGEHSHVAVSTTDAAGDSVTVYLCGLRARSGNLTWPTVDRSNVSCARCKAIIAKTRSVFA